MRKMKIKILLIIIIFAICSTVLFAHKDRILGLQGKNLKGLPERYQPAYFDFSKQKLQVGKNFVFFPKEIWKYIANSKKDRIKFSASWYHDPKKSLPYYLCIKFEDKDTNIEYSILIHLDNLSFGYFQRKKILSENSYKYVDVFDNKDYLKNWKVQKSK